MSYTDVQLGTAWKMYNYGLGRNFAENSLRGIPWPEDLIKETLDEVEGIKPKTEAATTPAPPAPPSTPSEIETPVAPVAVVANESPAPQSKEEKSMTPTAQAAEPIAPPAAAPKKKQPKWLLDVAARIEQQEKESEGRIKELLEERAKKGRGGLAFIPDNERKYKLWRVPFAHYPEFREHPEEYEVVARHMDQKLNERFTAWVESHFKKHGKLPSSVTRWNDPAPSAASLLPKEKKITAQGGISLVGRRVSSYSKKKIYWLWQDRIPFGFLCTVAGDPDEGKSLITLYIAARVSLGEKLYDNVTDTEPAEVLLLSAEDDPESTLRPRLEAAGADVHKIHLLESVSLKDGTGKTENERLAQLDTDIKMIEAYLDLYPEIKLVIVDPISSFLGSINMNREQDVRRVLQPLAKRAQSSGLAVIMVAHFNKNSDTRSAMDRVGGAKAIVGMGRAAWTCVREPQKEQQPGQPMPIQDSDRRLFLKLKGNLAPSKIGGLVYTIKAAPIEVESKDGSPVMVDTPYIIWLEKTDHTAQGIVIGDEKGKPNKPSKVELAKDWLRGHLESKGGFAPVESIEKDGQAHGHELHNLRRAKQQLGLRQEWVARESHWALKGTKIPPQLGNLKASP